MARLKDNSGGFWTEFINRRFNPSQFLRQNFIPNTKVMRKIGEEAISSVKGSNKHKIVIKRVHNNVVVHSFSTHGTYPNGIIKRLSFDGEEYPELKHSTLRHREWKAEHGLIPVNRGPQFIERETSQHILNGLKVKSVNAYRKRADVTIGWQGKNEQIADVQNKGGAVTSQWFDDMKTSEIPPHRFIGFQQQFKDNFYSIMKEFLRGSK